MSRASDTTSAGSPSVSASKRLVGSPSRAARSHPGRIRSTPAGTGASPSRARPARARARSSPWSAARAPMPPPADPAGKPVRDDVRNIAIIAHVDHGKTTLVDGFLRQAGTFRPGEVVADCAMDSNDLERERGITILAKFTAITWKGMRINIVDTPGHADFGGEVERVLKMVDSVLLLVDAFDGPMPQTRFVTRKALALGLRPILVVNKIDRAGCDPEGAVNDTFDLFCALGATDEQLDFPVVYASGREGFAVKNLADERKDLSPLLDLVVSSVPPPAADVD